MSLQVRSHSGVNNWLRHTAFENRKWLQVPCKCRSQVICDHRSTPSCHHCQFQGILNCLKLVSVIAVFFIAVTIVLSLPECKSARLYVAWNFWSSSSSVTTCNYFCHLKYSWFSVHIKHFKESLIYYSYDIACLCWIYHEDPVNETQPPLVIMWCDLSCRCILTKQLS